MPKENNGLSFEGCDPATLFREFAADCMQLTQTNCPPEKRALYLKMASTWFQMARRWEKKDQPGRRSAAKILTPQEFPHSVCSTEPVEAGDDNGPEIVPT